MGKVNAKFDAISSAKSDAKKCAKLGAKLGAKFSAKSDKKYSANKRLILCLQVLVDVKNAKNITISINNTDFFKKLEKNTLKHSMEAKKGAKKESNHRDLL